MTGPAPRRPQRVAERIKAELMEVLLRDGLGDPAAKGCYVTAVVMTDDLRQARVYFRLLTSDVTPEIRKSAVDALAGAAGFLRREIAPRLGLKYQPELRFFWDEGTDRAARIEELLSEIEREGTQ